MEFQYEKNRIYYTDANGKLLAEIAFSEQPGGVVAILHTFVAPSLRGQGVADQLMQAAMEQIQRAGKTVLPICSYAVDWLEKHKS